MTLLSRSATSTHIKPQMTHKPFRRTSALNMKLINSCLTFLVFIKAVQSAAMREGSEDLLYFLKDAFEMNRPLDRTEPTPLSEMDLATEKILDPVHLADPTAECEAPEIVVNSADFSNTTPKPNLVELTDVAEEKSIESSNSDSRLAERASAEDSREGDVFKSLRQGTALAVVEDISSQEMNRPEENGRYRPPRTQKLDKHNFVVKETDRQNLDLMKELDPIMQSFGSRMNLKDQAGKPHETDKRAMDLDSPEFVDTSERPDRDADSEERDGGRGTFQTQTSGIKLKLSYADKQGILDDSRESVD
ncbi:uncharacterized protein LOC113081696 isoform X1 [Carassius auratus]|uniref:Uncharacterized protein LOC113081696 isoform X1 n=1 Tax=Carassius auratus TaxID=7957 RepID=A0A6P6NKK3_CARAU|nr:uncharacterized protein LOC113081696 isoform X1 [Carassius auratus]